MNVFDVISKQKKGSDIPDFCGKIFITDSISDEQAKRLMSLEQLDDRFNVRAYLSKLEFMLFWVLAAVVLISSVALESTLLYSCLYQKTVFSAWYPLATLILSVAGWTMLYKKYKDNKRAVHSSPEYKAMEKDKAEIDKEIDAQFNVPPNAKAVTVLLKRYKAEKVDFDIYSDRFMSYVFTMYVENNCLNLSDAFQKLSFPLSSLTEIRKYRSTICYDYTNFATRYIDMKRIKDAKFTSGKYKMSVNDKGTKINPYYELCFDYQGAQYELTIPPYEHSTILEILGKRQAT